MYISYPLLLRSVRGDNGRYVPEALSVVLLALDEFPRYFEEATYEVMFSYWLVANLGLDCAESSFDPYRSDREELANRCYEESWRIQNCASQRPIPEYEYRYIAQMAGDLRTRAFQLSRALQPLR